MVSPCMLPGCGVSGCITSRQIRWAPAGTKVCASGRVIIVHTPPTRSKKRIMFLTLEDEDGLFDVTVFESVARQYAKIIMSNRILTCEGIVQRMGLRGVCVLARRIWAYENERNDKTGFD